MNSNIHNVDNRLFKKQENQRMKLIIDIPKYVYDLANIEDIIVDADIDKVISAIKTSKPYKERPTGHWFLLDECSNEGVYCSNCRKKVYRVEYANQKVKSNYCPNCGADMREEAKNDRS